MKCPIVLLVFALLTPFTTLGHPGSGIAVDSHGRMVFVDTGAGVWRLDTDGKLNKLPGPAYHWLAFDRTGRLSKVELPSFAENGARTVSVDQSILLASDFPITVDSQGALYYPRLLDGALRIFRFAPSGITSTFATVGADSQGKPLRWINGSAIDTDGTFYYTEDRGVWKITPQQEVVALYTDTPNLNCASVPGVAPESGPHFRGIDVDAKGNLFVAATACRAVIKIAPDKTVSTILQTSGAWSPTGLAVADNGVYVLEYFHTAGNNRREWNPRIRKIADDGSNSIIATVKRKQPGH
jgi:DNA-binding beta-propeller fold protein YncE